MSKSKIALTLLYVLAYLSYVLVLVTVKALHNNVVLVKGFVIIKFVMLN
jgi:hypothetical protein